MFKLKEILTAAVQAIIAHGFRSFLTTLGLVIAVAAIIVVVSIIQGLSYSITDQFKGLGTNAVSISSFTSFKDRAEGKQAKISHQDMVKIQHRIEGISHVTPMVAALGPFGGEVNYSSNSSHTFVMGTTASYLKLYDIYPKYGRFITPSDDKSRRRVCVIGEDVRQDLELPENPVGEFISIRGEWFKVVGLMESRGELLGRSQDDYVLMSYTTARSMLGTADNPDIQINLVVDDINQLEVTNERITRILRKAHNIKPGQDDDFKVQTAQQLTESVTSITDMLTAVFGGVVAISLLVGGVGIMNIMLVSVTERTREIGICKALGAQRNDILLQFLFEALILSFIGGCIGLALGFGIGAAVTELIPGFPDAVVPFWVIWLSFGFTSAVGIIFGIIPAAKAANLKPIDALRYE